VHSANDITLQLDDEAATLAFAERFAAIMCAGLVIYLHGDLGAGKTTFARGVLHGLGHIGKVKSPTYTLVEPYIISNYNVYHFDLYRFIDEEEWDAAGFRDYFNPQSICMIEWPEKAAHVLPQPDIHVHLSAKNAGRNIQLSAASTLGSQCLKKL
jgi:tRNA threonylcarbamoyladenosine biosynthesis protein TsaE